MMEETVKVHKFGFVKLVDVFGDDLKVVNAARISYNKRKDVFDDKDEALLGYLLENEHTAPLRHCAMTFHVKAPIFVVRQLTKHRIASEFNETSLRYVNMSGAEFFKPKIFRHQSADNKQGSYGQLSDMNQWLSDAAYKKAIDQSINSYDEMISLGVCREQARCVLPLAIYTEVYWTASLQAVLHFLNLREDSHAQKEIQDYARAVRVLSEAHFPNVFKAINGKNE